MKKLRILYIGDDQDTSTSFHRAQALRRHGHEVVHLNPLAILPKNKLVGALSTRVGLSFLAPVWNRYFCKKLEGELFDIAWVNCGAELGPSNYLWLKNHAQKIVNYQNDDPFGGRDGRKWDGYRKSLKYMDLAVVVRPPNVKEALDWSAQKTHRVYMSYDSIVHAPVVPTEAEREGWASDVVFVGTWMPERGPFMKALVEAGVPLAIRGNRWCKAPEWEAIKHVWKGDAVTGRDYILSLQLSKVALGLLSKGNRDLHTRRSAEIPYIGGGVFCAERTSEHQAMYAEGEEAEYWATPEECAEKCFKLLRDDDFRCGMARAAREKVKAMSMSNDKVVSDVLGVVYR